LPTREGCGLGPGPGTGQGSDKGAGSTGGHAVAESFGHIENPYPREYLALAPDVTTLANAATAAGGSLDPAPAAVFDPAGEVVQYGEDLWPRFVAAAIVLFLLDLLVRRVRWPSDKGIGKGTGKRTAERAGRAGRNRFAYFRP